jgi:hypothetical protein
MKISILDRAADLSTSPSELPKPSEVVEALLLAEKQAKKVKINHNFAELQGTWQLRFITGTKKTRQKAGVVLGSGCYLPKWLEIQIIYSLAATETDTRGTVKNQVKLGGLILSLTGPVKFLAAKNILAFDFTAINIEIFGLTLYQGNIRGGKSQEAEFYTQKIGKQAFFAYFLIQDSAIAARGKGGGLALWSHGKAEYSGLSMRDRSWLRGDKGIRRQGRKFNDTYPPKQS